MGQTVLLRNQWIYGLICAGENRICSRRDCSYNAASTAGGVRHHGIVTFASGVDPAARRPHSCDSALVQQQGHARAGDFVRARAIKDDVTIAGNLHMPKFQLMQVNMQRSLDDERIVAKIGGRAQIDHEQILACLLFLAELIDTDACDAQLSQEPLSMKIFVADVRAEQPDQHDDGAVTDLPESVQNPQQPERGKLD